MLDRNLALAFIEKELEIENAENEFKLRKTELLTWILRKFQSAMPFHNLWLLKYPHMPTEAEIIQDGLKRQGGSCVHLNYFFMLLLRAIGYDVYLIPGTYNTSPYPKAHMSCIVRGLDNTHSRHLLDVGGHAMFEPVPLHDLPKIYYQTGRLIKYTKSRKEGSYIRWNTKRDDLVLNQVRDNTDGQWCQVFEYFDKEVQYSHFEEFSAPVFTNCHPTNVLVNNLYLARYPGNKDAAICIIGRKLFEADDSGFGTPRLLSTDEVLPTIKRYFPEIPEEDVRIGLEKTAEFVSKDKTNSWKWIITMVVQYLWYWALYSGTAWLRRPMFHFPSQQRTIPFIIILAFLLGSVALSYTI